jgi:hypothetical protein
MKGVSRVTGPTTPLIGQNAFYEVQSFYAGTVVTNNNDIKWKVFRQDKGKWVELKGTLKTGKRVSFSFPQKWYGEQLLIEAYINNPEKKAPPGIIIKPSLGPKKIKSIDINDAKGNTLSKPPKYGQVITAKIGTENMLGDTLRLSLWERDTMTSTGHYPKDNTKLWSGTAKVKESNGAVSKQILLTPAMMTLANKTWFEGNTHEYYMLVEADNTRTAFSKETTVENKEIVLSPGAPAKPSTPQKTEPTLGQQAGVLFDQAVVKVRNLLGLDPMPETGKTATTVNQNGNGTGECICKKEQLVWGNKVNCDFRKKVLQISKELWPDNHLNMANGLMAVMYVETSGSFKAHQIMGKKLQDVKDITAEDFWLEKSDGTKTSRAVGLIQFTQAALEAIGEFTGGTGYAKLHATKLRFAKMGEVNQLDYVKKYFEPAKDSIKSPEDIYLHVFAPKGVGKANDYVLYEKGTEEYRQNKSVDTENDNDGKIQRSEILGRYDTSIKAGEGNKTSQFTCTAPPPSAKVSSKDIVVYHTFSDGRIEKHIPKKIKEGFEKKYKYVYHDAKNAEHEIATVDFVTAQVWVKGSKKKETKEYKLVGTRYYLPGTGTTELIKVPLPLNYTSGDLKIKMSDNTEREYMNPKAFAAIIGALAECSYADVTFNGFTSQDGTGSPSVSHVNGVAGDFRYLRKDKTGGALNIFNDPTDLDVERQEKLIDAFVKFGYQSFLSYNITLNKKAFILKKSSHLADHDHHIHLNRAGFSPTFTEIKEQ